MRGNYCKDCHWFKKNEPFKLLSNGKFLPCNNIPADGWEFWAKYQTEPEHCDGFCRRGEYAPTGIWADVGKILQIVEDVTEEWSKPPKVESTDCIACGARFME